MGIMNYINSLKETKNKFVSMIKPIVSSTSTDDTFDDLVTRVNTLIDNNIIPYRAYITHSNGAKEIVTPNQNFQFNSSVNIGTYANCVYMFRSTKFNQPITIPQSSPNYYGMFQSSDFNNPIDMSACYQTRDISGMMMGASKFNTSFNYPPNVINCYSLFNSCSNFSGDGLGSMPSTVVDCSRMFISCTLFNSAVEISKNALNCSNMFAYCYDQWYHPMKIPDHVVDCSYMFAYCRNMEGYDYRMQRAHLGINHWCNCSDMYAGCTNLSYEAHFPYGNCCRMFSGCDKMTSLICDMKTDEIFRGIVTGLRPNEIQSQLNTINYSGFVFNRSSSTRLNITICNPVLNKHFNKTSTDSIVGQPITWATDSANNCYYNTQFNIYVYYNYD